MILFQWQYQLVHKRYLLLLLTPQVLHCHETLTGPSLQAQIASVQPATGVLSVSVQERSQYSHADASSSKDA